MSAVGIRIESISKRFAHRVKGEVYAVRDVNLTVQPAELLTLLGPSGCGKTTTLRMIAGFEQPDAGRVFIGEQDVTGLMANRRNIGFVFQNYALFPHLSVFENVAYGLRVQRQSEQEIAQAVGDVLALVGLQGYDRQFPNQLSGGEQQRVALARAIVIRPRVLLFDEPLSNLDAKLRVHMRGELRELQQRLHITAVYVTHDQEEAMAISDRIAVMHQGQIVQEGTAEDLYRRPDSEFVAQFIGRTNLLSGRVQSAGLGGIELEVAGRHLRLSGDAARVTGGQIVRLVVRPEVIELRPADSGDGIPGTIASRTFLGEKAEYQVRVGADLLQVTSYNPVQRGLFSVGQPVTLHFPAEGIQLLPGGPA
ncbi:MAG: ABC transporter ATP-binding protein [candidate division NC10 bacterium]|nr:ABC transporter ATP-binding protein [candidate division NC10 bacterium]MBI2113694.1 ABC transporter ATP-binding protein [candidate division NC10 bacterium]MBI2456511.1 ABC transporter ATP-binding protein [candidate division NC10 bacterium]MBI2563535.1 ABC transporter ATP-binding protein [candidate division NC10 bacterium]